MPIPTRKIAHQLDQMMRIRLRAWAMVDRIAGRHLGMMTKVDYLRRLVVVRMISVPIIHTNNSTMNQMIRILEKGVSSKSQVNRLNSN